MCNTYNSASQCNFIALSINIHTVHTRTTVTREMADVTRVNKLDDHRGTFCLRSWSVTNKEAKSPRKSQQTANSEHNDTK